MLIVDGLSTWNAVGAVTGANLSSAIGTLGKNAALYFPRLKMPNPLNGGQVEAREIQRGILTECADRGR